ncbi:cyclic pyranopterin monophosphate synthase MoaC [bacterium]|nr:MAG: cyclic pyranopterin monophosphate synthase MoaC [bacterium]
MWDVSNKEPTVRTASARAFLAMSPDTVAAVLDGQVPKGDPLPVAKVAAVQAAKNTPDIIPYCHPLALEHVGVEFQIRDDGIEIATTVKTSGKTGVEMEALTAVSVAALTLYDMLKQLDMGMTIERVELLEKRGGKSDFDRSGRLATVVDDGQGEAP